MLTTSQIFFSNANLLKSRATRQAIMGAVLAAGTVILATLLATYLPEGNKITLGSLLQEQQSNVVLWVLDVMPFLFAFWGQYYGSVMAYEAGAMVLEQTEELREKATTLQTQVTHNMSHDGLTGLPNRARLLEDLENSIATVAVNKEKLALLAVDIDGFKEINETLGYRNGDRVIRGVSQRLEALFHEPALLFRLGSDEFAVIMPNIKHNDEVEQIAIQIHQVMQEAFTLDDTTLEVKVSVGAAIYPYHGSDADTLIKRADIAMNVANESGVKLVFYLPDLDKQSTKKQILMGGLHQAIEHNELTLHYQPIVSAQTGKLLGMEALVRWQHPTYGLLGPVDFLALAERTGLIKNLTDWILDHALEQLSQWQKAGNPISLSINASSTDLLDAGFPDTISRLLIKHGISGSLLIIEITEKMRITDQCRTMEVVARLASMGVQISIDDFGAGYSSLTYLKKLPISEIKIDKSFVLDMDDDESDIAIVKAIIQLAKSLSLRVVAVGVETEESMAMLQKSECTSLQGYWVSKRNRSF